MTREQARSLLGISDNATEKEITRAYRQLMATVHPDVCRGPEANRLAQQASEAREALCAADSSAPQAQQKEKEIDDEELAAYIDFILYENSEPLTKTQIAIALGSRLIVLGRSPDQANAAYSRVLNSNFLATAGAIWGWKMRGDRVWRTQAAQPASESGDNREQVDDQELAKIVSFILHYKNTTMPKEYLVLGVEEELRARPG